MSNKPLVLCIDDEQNILELLSFNLEASGYDTVTATSGTAGLEQAVSKSPALILLDLMLPDMDGTEVCRQLKAGPTTASIPIMDSSIVRLSVPSSPPTEKVRMSSAPIVRSSTPLRQLERAFS